MKKFLDPKILPWFTMGAGGLGLVLRLWLFSATDEKGLLPAKHPAIALSLILTVLVLAILFLCTRKLPPIAKYSRLYPAGIGRGIGCIVAAVGFLFGGLHFMGGIGGLGIVTFAASFAAALCMVFLALVRIKGARPAMVLHTIPTVFLMLFLVCNCRIWGSEPQMQIYLFPLFACVLLMLAGYYLTVLSVRKGSRQWLVFLSQSALFFCCLSLPGENKLFYLAMVIYLALDLCFVGNLRQPEER